VKDNELVFTRTLAQRAGTIPATEYQKVRSFLNNILKVDPEMKMSYVLASPRTFSPLLKCVLLLLIGGSTFAALAQQSLNSVDRDRGHVMLRDIKDDLKKNYYDPTYRGMDLDARFKVANDNIDKASSIGQIFGIVAKTLLDLNDSHTFFLPPERAASFEYGWQVQMIGDKAFVVAVKPASDAEAKGLAPGDQVVSVDGVGLTRQNLWVFHYLYNALRPQQQSRVVILKPDGSQQQIDVATKVVEGKRRLNLTTLGNDFNDLIRESENEQRLHRHRYVELGKEVFVWKMPEFDLSNDGVDEMVDKFRHRGSLILDLRGNGGGYVDTLLRLIGNVIAHDVKVGDLKSRKESKPMMAKTRGSEVFSGKLVVIIDNGSGSAAELFARIVQLEKRGIVIGDTSAGKVMQARSYTHQLGADTIVLYGVNITNADIIMTDGKSLEGTGVLPDEIKLPTASDLAAKRDPVLAYAVSLVGETLSPEKAGGLFPLEWKK
jgi:carboxyl-terminal processing protease